MLRSKVTARSQTTLPSGVRQALSLQPGEDYIEWEIHGDEVVARRATEEPGDEDPALGPFLDLLEKDLTEHPERLRGMPADLLERLRAVTRGIEVDLDERIEGPVAL